MQKSRKNRRKKNFLWDVFPCGLPISCHKKSGKSKWFCFFFVRGEGKIEINCKKKKKNFCPFGSFFTLFGRSFAGESY